METDKTVKFRNLEGILCLNVVNERHLFHRCGEKKADPDVQ